MASKAAQIRLAHALVDVLCDDERFTSLRSYGLVRLFDAGIDLDEDDYEELALALTVAQERVGGG